MENGFFLITGTSRGIGEALAKRILADGHTVLGVARSRSASLDSTGYHHLSFDLTDTARLAHIMERVDAIVDAETPDFICLVHNAYLIEPAASIDECPPAEIKAHVEVGLVAPMILTAMFMKRFAHGTMRKKVAFISSGAAVTPAPDASLYCGCKAGLHMFAQCIGLEQKDMVDGFEVVSISPGMVDTDMQLAIRSKSPDEHALAGFFQQAHAAGKLQEPGAVADAVFKILENTTEPGQLVRL